MILLKVLEEYIFAGVPSNAAWDLIKVAWEKFNGRSWEELYLEAFRAAFDTDRSHLTKYVHNGELSFDEQKLLGVLHQDLGIVVEKLPISQLTEKTFIDIVAVSLKEREALIIGGHNLTEEDYAQLIRNLVQNATMIFKDSVIQNPIAFQQAMIDEAIQNRALVQEAQTFLENRFDIVIRKLDVHTTLLEKILTDVEEIKKGLGLDRDLSLIRAEIEVSIEKDRPDLFGPDGLCTRQLLIPALNQFFVAQEFSIDREDLLRALTNAFQEFNLVPYRADQDVTSEHILCKIAAKIQTTLFGVFELTQNQNRNVYLELGIALGLCRPFVLVKEVEAEVSYLTQGLDYYNLQSYTGLQYDLGNRLRQYLLNVTRYQRNTSTIPNAFSSTSYILSYGDYDMPPDFCLAIAKTLQGKGFIPTLLGINNREVINTFEKENVEYKTISSTDQTRLDATVQAIKAARFGVYRIDSGCSADAFLSLGLAIGLNRPWMLISRAGKSLPSDVRGLNGLEFNSFEELEKQFPNLSKDFLFKHSK